MSKEALEQEYETEEHETEAVIETEGEVEEHGPSDEDKEKASQQGWAPEDKWRGDPDKWVDADEFLKRGQNNNAILRERNDKLTDEITSLRSEIRDSVKQFGEATRRAEERAYSKAMEDLKKQQKEAVADGDIQAWEHLETQKEGLQEDFKNSKEARQTATTQKQTVDDDPAFKGWAGENNWYNSDVEQTVYANQAAQIIGRKYTPDTNGHMPREFYDEISREVKKKFPQKFRNTNRDAPGSVQGASYAGGGRRGNGKTYADLPADAKIACDRFVKQGLMKKEQYVKDYFGE